LTTTDVLIATGSAGLISIILPSVVGIAGKVFQIIRTDTTLSNVINIVAKSGENIQGFTSKRMHTANECFVLVSDGERWRIISHSAGTRLVDGGIVTVNGTTSNPVLGTGGQISKNLWFRNGQFAEIIMQLQVGITGYSNGSGDYIFTLPANLDVDTTFFTEYNTLEGSGGFKIPALSVIGTSDIAYSNGTENGFGVCILYSPTQYRIGVISSASSLLGIFGSGYFGYQGISTVGARIKIPIADWDC
jgi:hypothetical protein